MYYGEIKKHDIANGIGVRVSIFVSGCRVHCPGCFNKKTWDFKYGKEFTEQTEKELLEALAPGYIAGLTVLGGEPFEQENQKVLEPFLRKVKQLYPNKDIWCYTGYTLDKDLLPVTGKKHTEYTESMVKMIDTLVDGQFILAKKDISLKFRGSSNQRVLDIKNSIKNKSIVLKQ